MFDSRRIRWSIVSLLLRNLHCKLDIRLFNSKYNFYGLLYVKWTLNKLFNIFKCINKRGWYANVLVSCVNLLNQEFSANKMSHVKKMLLFIPHIKNTAIYINLMKMKKSIYVCFQTFYLPKVIQGRLVFKYFVVKSPLPGWRHRLLRHCSRYTSRRHISPIPLYHLSRLHA